MQRGAFEMFVRNGAVRVECTSNRQGEQSFAGSDDHGQQAICQCDVFWHVPVYGKSDSGGGDSGGDGSLDADALRAGDGRSVDAGLSDGDDRKLADVKQLIKADVHLGRTDPDYITGFPGRDCSVRGVGVCWTEKNWWRWSAALFPARC